MSCIIATTKVKLCTLGKVLKIGTNIATKHINEHKVNISKKVNPQE